MAVLLSGLPRLITTRARAHTTSPRTATMLVLVAALSIPGCNDGHPAAPLRPSTSDMASVANGKSPSNLTAGAYYFDISLSWTDNSHNETRFDVLRSSTGATGTFTTIGSTGANVTTYVDTAIAPLTQYCYQVTGHQGSRVLGTSNTACVASMSLLPTAPYNVVAALPNGSQIDLSWQDSSVALTGFRIEKGTATTGPWTAFPTIGTVNSYIDYKVVIEQEACYHVIALNAKGESPPSPASCTALPAPPTNTRATSVDAHTIDVTWTDASIYEDGYDVWRYGPDNVWVLAASLPANTVSFRDAGLQSDSWYSYWVRARKDGAFTLGDVVRTVTADVPPVAPVIQSFPLSSITVETNWTPVPLAVGYSVERSLDGGATWQPAIASSTYSYLTPPPFLEDGLSLEQLVCYRATAYNDRGTSPPSNTACTAIPTAPTIQDGVAVDDQSVDLYWADDSNVEDGYEIDYVWYDEFGDPYYYVVATLPANTSYYRVTGLSSATQYDFVVYATRDGGYSDPSNDFLVTTAATPVVAAPSASLLRAAPARGWRGPISRYMTHVPQSSPSRAGSSAGRVRRSAGSRRRIPVPIGVPERQSTPLTPLPSVNGNARVNTSRPASRP